MSIKSSLDFNMPLFFRKIMDTSEATVLVKAKKANEIQYTCSWCLKVNFLDDKNCDHRCEVCDIFLCSACMVYPKRSLK